MKRRLTAMGLAVAVLLAGALQLTVDEASSQTPTPTSTPEPLGSISGRVYVDVDANVAFGGPDVPLEFPLNLFRVDAGGPQPPFLGTNSAADGTYHFGDLPAGTYELGISIPIPAGCPAPNSPYTWVGDTFTGLSCPSVSLTTPSKTLTLAAGEDATGVDFPQIPPSYEVTARAWLDGAPLSANNRIAITVGGRSCWGAQIRPVITAAEIPVSFYLASLLPSADPACQNADLDITIDGRPAGATTQWNRFWRDSLFSPGPRPLNKSSEAFPTSVDLEVPPFLGISGQVAEAGTVTPDDPSGRRALVRDGTEIKAFVGTTLCGSTRTKTLTSSTGGFGGNLFGLIVPPADVKPECGIAGAPVTFCVGTLKARQPAAGPFSGFVLPQAEAVLWAAPALAEVTLEPTSEPCPGSQLPGSLPPTGGPDSEHAAARGGYAITIVLGMLSLAGLAGLLRRRVPLIRNN